ncbi:MAG: DUF4160 domain-containing protein [Clostridia bacterium]|nr:DUF4160 domain-containing protein [Clostridia bacterium]
MNETLIKNGFVSLKDANTIYEEWYKIFTIIIKRERVTTIDSISIYIYPKEDIGKHKNPHLHAYYQDQSVVIDLNNFEVIEGNLNRKKQKLAIEWVKKNKNLLYKTWNKLNDVIKLPVF